MTVVLYDVYSLDVFVQVNFHSDVSVAHLYYLYMPSLETIKILVNQSTETLINCNKV